MKMHESRLHLQDVLSDKSIEELAAIEIRDGDADCLNIRTADVARMAEMEDFQAPTRAKAVFRLFEQKLMADLSELLVDRPADLLRPGFDQVNRLARRLDEAIGQGSSGCWNKADRDETALMVDHTVYMIKALSHAEEQEWLGGIHRSSKQELVFLLKVWKIFICRSEEK